ncbi:MAG TPA: hypothetical protein VFN10_05695 [Thermoanaerobaculia bacterium]|nr:hypothetical protein [Thermoanaerobaculia bacterium]
MKTAVAKAKAPAKAAAKAIVKAVKKVAKAAPKAAKKVAAAKAPAIVKPKAVKPAVKKAPVAAPKVAPKAAPKAAAAKPAPKAEAKPAAKVAAPKAVAPPKAAAPKVAAPKAIAAKPAPAPAPAPARPTGPVVVDDKKRARRARPRVTSSGAPAASWLTSEKPRAASFIPAPPRAEAPSAIAAPPASSDRLIRPEDLNDIAVRTVPVRVDIEQAAGRFYVIPNPQEVTLRAGEGIEWDFRYFGGADVTVEEIIIEFEKPSPFLLQKFQTKKPGTARPHRQMSGGVQATATGKRVEYVIRAMTPFRTELASARSAMNVMS